MRFPIRFIKENTSIDFMRWRWVAFGFSLVASLATAFLMISGRMNYGIDFTGGILMEIRTEKPISLKPLRQALEKGQFGEVALQSFGEGNDILVRIQSKKDANQAKTVEEVKTLLSDTVGKSLEFRKIDYVGPTVGRELLMSGILASVLAMAAIMIYLWFRFEWQYGVGGTVALLHDAVMVLGFFAVTQYDFGLTAVAAVLTIVGYSINDSVVIYDRIRENMRKYKQKSLYELINLSANETLSRTILTATTTLIAALVLFLFGGEVIRGFSAALVFGIIFGTYSSIYISAPILIYLGKGLEFRQASDRHAEQTGG